MTLHDGSLTLDQISSMTLHDGILTLDQVSMTLHVGSLTLDYRSMTLDHGSMTLVYIFMSFIQYSSCEAMNTQLCFCCVASIEWLFSFTAEKNAGGLQNSTRREPKRSQHERLT